MPEYRQIIHELNQRYKEAWDRAERLQDELDHIKQSRAYRLLALWRRWFGSRQKSADNQTMQLLPFDSKFLDDQQVSPSGTVSVLIAFKDRVDLLRNCLRGLRLTTYPRHEILLLDNGSTCPRTTAYLERGASHKRFRVIACPGPFHFAQMCNEGARHATGNFLLFLNNDVEVISPDWLGNLLRLGCTPSVGVAGATLLYPDETLQHAGIFPRADGQWTHLDRGLDTAGLRRAARPELFHARTVPAVTGACLLIRRSLFIEMGGFNEDFAVTMNDVDLCERVRSRGLKVAISPDARLFHFESLSRGYSR